MLLPSLLNRLLVPGAGRKQRLLYQLFVSIARNTQPLTLLHHMQPMLGAVVIGLTFQAHQLATLPVFVALVFETIDGDK
jgi:hypothetical protein